MAKRGSPAFVGTFVIGAIALGVAAVALLGSGHLFRQSHQFVCFFDGNVNGLRVGAAVKFKGVQIGEVRKILLSLNSASGPIDLASSEIKIPVVIELDQGQILKRGVAYINVGNPAGMKLAISRGLRAQLAMESLLTGLLYVDLDMHPGTRARFVTDQRSSTYPEIPTLPTAFEQAQSVALKMIGQLDKVQIDRLVLTATEALAAVRDLAESQDLKDSLVALKETGQSLQRTSESVRTLTANLDREIGPLSASARTTAKNADATFKQTQVTLAHLDETLRPDAPLLYQANHTMVDLSEAARAVRQLAEYLERNPDAVVRGRSYKKESE